MREITCFCNLLQTNSLIYRWWLIGYETRIGFNDIKSSPVYFYVQKTASFGILNTPIPFEIERLNIGGAMSLATGVFTAPKSGLYLFIVSGIAAIENTHVYIFLNDVQFGASYGRYETYTYSLQSTLILQTGDRIALKLATGAIFESSGEFFTHFTGILLEEYLL